MHFYNWHNSPDCVRTYLLNVLFLYTYIMSQPTDKVFYNVYLNPSYKIVSISRPQAVCNHDKLTNDNGDKFCPVCNPPF